MFFVLLVSSSLVYNLLHAISKLMSSIVPKNFSKWAYLILIKIIPEMVVRSNLDIYVLITITGSAGGLLVPRV
jgi:hypothetical protein